MDLAELSALRRDIHRYAEPAFLEIRTSAIVARRLLDLSVDVRRGSQAMRLDEIAAYPGEELRQRFAERASSTGAEPELVDLAATEGTAIVAELEGDRPGPTWGIRIDMDALPLTEATEERHLPAAEGFRCDDGYMHACAHDTHTVIGLALAERLRDDRAFPGTVRLFFQPAEEGGRGARAMLGAGVAEGVDRFVAVHLGMDLAPGTVVGGVTGLLATTKLRASYSGVAAHAAGAPQEGRNALVGAATAILNVMAIPRFATADTRINVGTLRGGDNVNIVPSYADMTLEARSDDGRVAADLTARIETVLRGAAAMHGLEVEIEHTGGSTTMRCDDELVDAIVALATARYGTERVRRTHRMGGSDDASLFAADVQRQGGIATYFLVGGGNEAPHHNPFFDVAEDAMPVAIDTLEALIRAGG